MSDFFSDFGLGERYREHPDVAQALLKRAQTQTGADLVRVRETLQAMLCGRRPCDEDLREARDLMAHVSDLSLHHAQCLREGDSVFSWPASRAEPQRPGVPAHVLSAAEETAQRMQKKAPRRPSALAEPADTDS